MMAPCIKGQLTCRCCGKGEPAELLIRALRALSLLLGCSLVVTSLCRCRKHNAETAGSSKNSYHMMGMACDFHVEGIPIDQVCRAMEEVALNDSNGATIYPFRDGGIGCYPDRGFAHGDVRGRKARWGYIAGRLVPYEEALAWGGKD